MSGGTSGRGGARPGAGRRKGDGCKWGEPTRVMRIPASRIAAVSDFLTHAPALLRPAEAPPAVPLPLFGHTIRAGFPSPADDYVQDSIDLNAHLIRHKAATFLLRVRGDSMIDAGILPGDIVLVEKGPRPAQNDIVVACVDDEWTLKYYVRDVAGVRLEPANPKYKFIRPKHSLEIGGVVRAVIRKY